MEQTLNYDLFKSIVSNREVDQKHVAKLVKAISKKNMLHLNPIICNADFEVIDGQHRLEAAKQLDLPIFYIIDAEVNKSDIANINSNAKNWSVMDYVNYWTVEKKPGFDKLSSFLFEFPHMKTSTVLMLIGSDGIRNTSALKEGVVDVSNYDEAVKIAEIINYFRNYFEWAFDRNFIMAFAKLYKHEKYDHEIMKVKVDLQPRSLVRCINQTQYQEILLEIYNYKSSTNRISF